jgi:hypothetical protein
MALTKVLITVKTYPTLSEKYDELVCTAGFLSVDEKLWPEIKENTIKEFEKSHQIKAKRFIFPE